MRKKVDTRGKLSSITDANAVETTVNFMTNVISEVKETAKKVVTNAANTFTFSSWKPLENKDLEYRHDEDDESTREREYVHLRGEKEENTSQCGYSMNYLKGESKNEILYK